MKIVSAHLYALHLPFKMPFSHKLMTRSYSDSIIVKLTAESGESGFGEGIPRPYVTGETVSSCLDHMRTVLLPLLEQHDLSELSLNEPMTLLSEIGTMLPDSGKDAVIAFNASKAAVEIALIDLLLKQHGRSLRSLIPPAMESVTYSAVIAADSADKVRKIALKCGQYGIKQVKIKVGTGDDYNRIADIPES